MVVPGTGICLNNFLYWGEVDLHGTNPLLPGASFALPMAPTISTRNDGRCCCWARPAATAFARPRRRLWCSTSISAWRCRRPSRRRARGCGTAGCVQAEGRIPAATLDALRERGHAVETTLDWTMQVGGMQGIAIDPASGVATGGADPRREGYVAIP